jgi:hypothetical protein
MLEKEKRKRMIKTFRKVGVSLLDIAANHYTLPSSVLLNFFFSNF